MRRYVRHLRGGLHGPRRALHLESDDLPAAQGPAQRK